MTVTENELVKRHTGLVVIQAALFTPTSLSDFDDYMSAGRIGLLKAIRQYDKTVGLFSTYAMICIRREMIREAIRDKKPKEKFVFNELDILVSDCTEDWTEILPDTLDNVELEVIKMRADGYTLKEIGQRFDHTKQWAGNKLKRIFQKIRDTYE
jgi:RNA polymerase sporulation-specific sigma factor